VQFNEPGKARFSTPDESGVDYVGSATRLHPLDEQVWRGTPSTGQGGDLVAFLRRTACSDGMSEVTHPVTARVSLGDRRAFAGCCRVLAGAAPAPTAAPPVEGSTRRLAALRSAD
jgi:uncharacterized membrane protein